MEKRCLPRLEAKVAQNISLTLLAILACTEISPASLPITILRACLDNNANDRCGDLQDTPLEGVKFRATINNKEHLYTSNREGVVILPGAGANWSLSADDNAYFCLSGFASYGEANADIRFRRCPIPGEYHL